MNLLLETVLAGLAGMAIGVGILLAAIGWRRRRAPSWICVWCGVTVDTNKPHGEAVCTANSLDNDLEAS